MDRLESMTVLVAVIETGSLSAAGRKLGMPLATVSRKLSDLEAHLKTRLLNRSTRQLALTDAGRSYVESCRRILEDIGEAERAATGEYAEPRGNLVITAPIVFGRLHVLPVVTDFLKAYPEIDIRLALGDRVVNLLEDQVDLAVRIGELPDSSLIATRVGLIRRVVCGSPAYFTKHAKPKTPDDLAGHACVTFEGLTAANHWSFTVDSVERAIPVRSRISVNTAEAAIDAALAGIGITRVLSYQVAAALKGRKLVSVLQHYESDAVPISLVYSGQGRLPLKLRAFIDYAVPRLRTRLGYGA